MNAVTVRCSKPKWAPFFPGFATAAFVLFDVPLPPFEFEGIAYDGSRVTANHDRTKREYRLELPVD